MKREKVYCAFDSNAFNEIVEGKREGVIENNLTSAGIVRKAYYWRNRFEDGDIISHDVGGYIYLARFKEYLSNTDFECHEMVSINTVKDSAVIYKDTIYTLKGFEPASIDETRQFYKYIKEDEIAKSELKPFDKVLVRDADNQRWRASLYSHRFSEGHYCMGLYWKQCIPYTEKTAKLLGTTDKYEKE